MLRVTPGGEGGLVEQLINDQQGEGLTRFIRLPVNWLLCIISQVPGLRGCF